MPPVPQAGSMFLPSLIQGFMNASRANRPEKPIEQGLLTSSSDFKSPYFALWITESWIVAVRSLGGLHPPGVLPEVTSKSMGNVKRFKKNSPWTCVSSFVLSHTLSPKVY